MHQFPASAFKRWGGSFASRAKTSEIRSAGAGLEPNSIIDWLPTEQIEGVEGNREDDSDL
jgi:hypothetical protein